ncbi:MAG: MAPEG family protein [Rhodobacter sp.]|uniref:MAPEG family protein n=1 Tax=Pararhodobacter sp. TaxID=2127056 RepID=UPI001E058D1E|nr:MAPEG family protein [Pararhodobacter sp.]MCB1345321.1 MAPEG family protein [Paracoccaceae bacterium]MCC0074898.1 MAPEG family protein [Rhodobacter sp.]HPD91227.1 MAPEG family protein [Pararhodobacter sp.]
MTSELMALTLAALLQGLQFALYSVLAQRQVGTRYAASPRDVARQLTGQAGRAQRALANHFEGLILFTIAVLVVTLADQSGPVTRYAAWTYLGARVLYIPGYLLGWAPGRSLIWFVGFGATMTMLVAALI